MDIEKERKATKELDSKDSRNYEVILVWLGWAIRKGACDMAGNNLDLR